MSPPQLPAVALMLSPTPAVRAAFFGIVLATALAVVGAAMHLSTVGAHVTAKAAAGLQARAEAAAAVLGGFDKIGQARQLVALAGDAEGILYDAAGRIATTTDGDLARAADWPRTLAALGNAEPVAQVAGSAYVVAGADLADGRVILLAAAPQGIPERAWTQTIFLTTCLWGLLIGTFALIAWYTGPRTAHQLSLLGERIAQGSADADALIRHAAIWLGPLADAFRPVAQRIRAQVVKAEEMKHLLAALYQINPHYVVLCTQDGEIVEANPAFYAATGLSPDLVRGGTFDALRDTLPIEPLLPLAERSLKEASSISGVDYALVDRDDVSRSVEVSLRGFRLEGRAMVLIQATDKAHERQLERRVAAFTDTLDLMVDQRVSQLSAGRQGIRRVLDTAGILLASFDAGGTTTQWSGALRVFSRRTVDVVPHFAAVAESLGLAAGESAAFTRWFWSHSPDPFIGVHTVVNGEGVTRSAQVVWQRIEADMAGRSDHRTLIGVEIPAYVPLGYVGDGVASPSAIGL